MNREETLSLLAVLKAAYPTFYKDMKRSEAEGIVDLWTAMFADDPVDLVAIAVKAFIANDTKGFPPHIGAIKESITKLKSSDELTEMEAWGLVQNALRNALYNSKEEFDKLPHEIQRLVGSPNQLREWAMMEADSVNSVVASNFQRSYKVRMKSNRELLALPGDVRMAIAQIADGLAIERRPALLSSNEG